MITQLSKIKIICSDVYSRYVWGIVIQMLGDVLLCVVNFNQKL